MSEAKVKANLPLRHSSKNKIFIIFFPVGYVYGFTNLWDILCVADRLLIYPRTTGCVKSSFKLTKILSVFNK